MQILSREEKNLVYDGSRIHDLRRAGSGYDLFIIVQFKMYIIYFINLRYFIPRAFVVGTTSSWVDIHWLIFIPSDSHLKQKKERKLKSP